MRGWGAAHLLRPVTHCDLRAHLRAFDMRVNRMMSRLETTTATRSPPRSATATRRRGRSPSAHFGVDWADPEGYDLSLNTERMTVDQCAEEIIQLARQPEFCETDESRKRSPTSPSRRTSGRRSAPTRRPAA